jgi:hypothetical protein
MKHHGLGNLNVTNKTKQTTLLHTHTHTYIYNCFVDPYYFLSMCCFIPLLESIKFFITFVQKRDVFVCDIIATMPIVTNNSRFILHGFHIQINPRYFFHVQWPPQLKISCGLEL